MKKILFMSAIVATAMLTACNGGPGAGKSLEEINAKNDVDSLSWYYGQIYADDYWAMANRDSIYAGDKAKKAYYEGVVKGLNLLSDDEAYNEGLRTGLQIATNMVEFKKEFGEEINSGTFKQSLSYGLRNDSISNAANANTEMNFILARMQARKDAAALAIAKEKLAEEAQKLNMKIVTPMIYMKVVTKGTDEKLKQGDRQNFSVQINNLSGAELPGMPSRDVTLGEEVGLNTGIGLLVSQMHKDETAEFLTTASEFFGNNVRRLNLKPDDILKVLIKVSPATTEKKD